MCCGSDEVVRCKLSVHIVNKNISPFGGGFRGRIIFGYETSSPYAPSERGIRQMFI
jgi:hypothetical protein